MNTFLTKKNPRYIHYFNYINFEKVTLRGEKGRHAMKHF